MAVIQDEQGNNKPIVTDTSHVFDANGNPLHGELFIGETIASDNVEEADPFADSLLCAGHADHHCGAGSSGPG